MNIAHEPEIAGFNVTSLSSYTKLLMEVKLGNPRHGCLGTGICSIDLVSPLKKKHLGSSAGNCRRLIARCSLVSWNVMKMDISIKNLCCSECFQLLDSGFFEIPAPVEIPMKICLYWNANFLKIKTGYYPVIKNRTTYSIKLDLQRGF